MEFSCESIAEANELPWLLWQFIHKEVKIGPHRSTVHMVHIALIGLHGSTEGLKVRICFFGNLASKRHWHYFCIFPFSYLPELPIFTLATTGTFSPIFTSSIHIVFLRSYYVYCTHFHYRNCQIEKIYQLERLSILHTAKFYFKYSA